MGKLDDFHSKHALRRLKNMHGKSRRCRETKSFHVDIQYLVGGLEHDFYDFPYIGNVIIPTDFHSIIFQRGRLNHQPDIDPTPVKILDLESGSRLLEL